METVSQDNSTLNVVILKEDQSSPQELRLLFLNLGD